MRYGELAYILKKSMTSGDNGEAPDVINRTCPPSFAFILLKTSLSHIGYGFLPEGIECKDDSTYNKESANKRN